MNSWRLAVSEVFDSRSKRSEKKHPEETRAMFNNLDTYLATLNAGVNVAQIKAGFIHPEQMGVKALDQKGAKGYPTQTRLYIYPDENTRTVYLITIGEKGKKKVQNKDVSFCGDFVKAIRKKESNDG